MLNGVRVRALDDDVQADFLKQNAADYAEQHISALDWTRRSGSTTPAARRAPSRDNNSTTTHMCFEKFEYGALRTRTNTPTHQHSVKLRNTHTHVTI